MGRKEAAAFKRFTAPPIDRLGSSWPQPIPVIVTVTVTVPRYTSRISLVVVGLHIPQLPPVTQFGPYTGAAPVCAEAHLRLNACVVPVGPCCHHCVAQAPTVEGIAHHDPGRVNLSTGALLENLATTALGRRLKRCPGCRWWKLSCPDDCFRTQGNAAISSCRLRGRLEVVWTARFRGCPAVQHRPNVVGQPRPARRTHRPRSCRRHWEFSARLGSAPVLRSLRACV